MSKKMLDKLSKQPVSSVQWLPASKLTANNYNPNHVAPPELALLKLSIMSEGWTQPIVIRPDYEIIDGYHRWLLVTRDKEVAALTEGCVPVVLCTNINKATQMMATIRHNRGRGSHGVLKMAEIVATLDAEGTPHELIIQGLGMDEEELGRLLDRGNMLLRGSREDFNKGKVAI